MAQQFSGTPQIKTRTAVLVFVKGSSAPVVLYADKPQALYEEFQQIIKTQSPSVVEKEGNGPIKKITLLASQIAAVSLQDEQYV